MPSTHEYYERREELDFADQRASCQRDRDRILYSSAFRRLSGVTQVVAPSEGHIFHNRLTHSIEVAQITRRIAENLLFTQPDLAAWHDGIDEDAAEAAALAHDLGHPPFGHVAEEELDILVRKAGLFDGYEGNAQSFRIVTKLAVRKDDFRGLNLTRVTLNGMLKYPWRRELHGRESKKWGAYYTERTVFGWVRKIYPMESKRLSVEAELMTWADDIAYSIHDTEDFYRARLIPLDRLSTNKDERDRFLESVFGRWEAEGKKTKNDEKDRLSIAFIKFCDRLAIAEPYSGTRLQRLALREFTAPKIRDCVQATQLQEDENSTLRIPEYIRDEIRMLKELTRHYVINNASLASQQYGHRRIIRELFTVFMDAANSPRSGWALLPPRFEEELRDLTSIFGHYIPHDVRVRTVADAIASLTDIEALRVFQRISGVLPGSVLDPLIT